MRDIQLENTVFDWLSPTYDVISLVADNKF
jgi:hypothetical protein